MPALIPPAGPPPFELDKLAPYRKYIGLDLFAAMLGDLRLRPQIINYRIFASLISLNEIFGDANYNPRQAWLDTKKRVLRLRPQLSENFLQLKMLATDGKFRKTEAADLATCVKVIFSMQTPTAIQFQDMIADRIAGIAEAELNYRILNIAKGSEWSADSIHEQMKQLKPVPDSELKYWEK